MRTSHITNKEVSRQNILYLIGYKVITILIGYMTRKYSLPYIYPYSIFGYEVVSQVQHEKPGNMHPCNSDAQIT